MQSETLLQLVQRAIAKGAQSSLDGAMLARVTQALFAAEVAPGGPYQESGTSNLLLNATIAAWLQTEGIQLPNVAAFLYEQIASAKLEAEEIAVLARLEDEKVQQLLASLGIELPSQTDTEVKGAVDALIAALPPSLQASVLPTLERIWMIDARTPISALARLSRLAVGKSALAHVSPELDVQLGAATVLGWLAYTAADDFFDEEGTPALLPGALWALRVMREHYAAAVPDIAFQQQVVEPTLVKLDDATAWELTHCRIDRPGVEVFITVSSLPDFGDLSCIAGRSIGHAIGPLAMAWQVHGEQALQLLPFFTHFLIARQLNDDANDWLEDLQRGQISPVAAALIRRAAGYGEVLQGKYEVVIAALQHDFAHHYSTELCGVIREHLVAAERAVQESGCCAAPEYLLELLAPLKLAVDRAGSRQGQMQAFLNSFHQTR